MKIHIMGASCAGSTTLGNALAVHTGFPYFDTDDYFWEPAEVPYTVRRNPTLRNKLLLADVTTAGHGIVGGSLVSWGEEWKRLFDLVIFLYVPQSIRMERLKAREVERYGNIIHIDARRALLYREFIAWAGKYNDRSFTGRNIQVHENWLSQVSGKVLEIRGDTTLEERLTLALPLINK